MVDNPGDLYIVATPIGNLGDMVPRGLQVLQRVDWVAAEDTRHSGNLLTHFNIRTPLVAYHDHSDERGLRRILDSLARGESVALISDAGTPLVSDPGFRLVREARALGARVVPVPGCCAAIAALSAAGLPSDRFTFEGFLPARETQRAKALEALARETRTLIFYEAPHRVLQTLQAMASCFGPAREAVVARELTKTHETFLTGTLQELVEQVAADANQQRGEIVLLVRGAAEQELASGGEEQLRVLAILLEDLSVKQASALAARITGGNKKVLYQQAVALKGAK
ncbi:MAG: 16S rRNA (cytidine(1402)-2'-O)-methyltransferase [Porticoccaceae bacterium]